MNCKPQELTVLIVEDEDEWFRLAKGVIGQEVSSVWVRDAESAIAQLRARRFDAVICDLYLPQGAQSVLISCDQGGAVLREAVNLGYCGKLACISKRHIFNPPTGVPRGGFDFIYKGNLTSGLRGFMVHIKESSVAVGRGAG